MRTPSRRAVGRRRPEPAWLAGALATAVAAATAQGVPARAVPPVTVAQASLPPVEVVEIVAVAPLPGQGIDRDMLPYTTQWLRAEAIERAQADTLTDLLNRRFAGVQLNDVQGSPFQADLTYRGHRASALLGAGQGLSVVLDGVRVNEPFGDVVHWDGVPEFSLNTVTLLPAANPAFGLNSLGGALALTTHTGRSAPGWRADVGLGSFGRRRVDVSHGAHGDAGWHHYVAASAFEEDGWRDHSAGRLARLLVKAGREGERTDWDLALLLGRSRLLGNGLVPAETLELEDGRLEREPDLVAGRREAVYSHPDLTRNRLQQLALTLRHRLDDTTELGALVYLRSSRRDGLNGDAAEEPQEPVEGEEGDEAGQHEPNAALNTTHVRQRSAGASLRLSGRHAGHRWQVGATLDASRSRYAQFEQEGFFTGDRGVRAGDEAPELSARVEGRSVAAGLYGSDTWSLTPRTHLTATLRFNHARVSNTLTSVDDDTDEVRHRPTERFRYDSLNPALGIAHRLGRGATLFANVSRNNRVPTVIELGCADPAEPCRLPAGLQSDPYLKQVIARSIELGVRGAPFAGGQASLALWRTDHRDDILFRSVSASGQRGYFANFPRTRHQGVDVELQGKVAALQLGVAYSHLRATFEAHGLLRQGERNVAITPGTPIAGLPRHQLKAWMDVSLGGGLTIGADVQAVSSRGVMGNEDGALSEDAGAPRERLKLAGHALMNLRADWQPPGRGWSLSAKLLNVFDRRHENFGALAQTVFDAQGAYTGDGRPALFVAPGAPRTFFVAWRWRG